MMNNNPYNMWMRPPCQNMGGFNSPPGPRPVWSSFQAPVSHMSPRGPAHFMPPPMQQSFQNGFRQPQMVNLGPPARFAQFQFQPNQNGFHNNNKNQQNSGNRPNHYGSSPRPNNHKQNPQQRDKQPGNQNKNKNFNENNKNQNGKKKNKNKPNKRDLPENCAFYCDICDRGFKTEEKFQEHVDGHEQCKEDGCSYVAAPKLVQLHVRNHHHTGLAKKIWSVESKEDIQKWISERKKNFPTTENIKKKHDLFEEKKARGEVLNEKQFYHRPHDQRMKRKGPWWKKRELNDCPAEGSPPEKKRLTEREKNEADKQICDKKETNKTTESSDPLSTILDNDSVNSSNDADDKEEKSSSSPSKSLLLNSSLQALQTIYNSDEDDQNEGTDDKRKSETSTTTSSDTTVLKDLNNSENQHQKSENNPRHQHQRFEKSRNQLRREEAEVLTRRPWHSKVFKRERPTFLEKLLAKEIRHERNVILQCIRHIVQNDFFEKPISVSPDE